MEGPVKKEQVAALLATVGIRLEQLALSTTGGLVITASFVEKAAEAIAIPVESLLERPDIPTTLIDLDLYRNRRGFEAGDVGALPHLPAGQRPDINLMAQPLSIAPPTAATAAAPITTVFCNCAAMIRDIVEATGQPVPEGAHIAGCYRAGLWQTAVTTT